MSSAKAHPFIKAQIQSGYKERAIHISDLALSFAERKTLKTQKNLMGCIKGVTTCSCQYSQPLPH
jgi:hypothetical protein